MTRRRGIVLVSFLSLLLLIGFVSFIFRSDSSLELSGTPQGGDFKLMTTQGIFDTQEHRGKNIVLFFGFTNCPHICPMTLQNLKKALGKVSPEEVVVLFVSVDIENDDLPRLSTYMQDYPSNFYAGTGSRQELKQIMDLFGASAIKHEYENGHYYEHTTNIYFINKQGVWVEAIDYSSTPEHLAQIVSDSEALPAFWSKRRQMRLHSSLGENTACDLAREACTINLENYEKFTVRLSDFPITAEKKLKIEVEDHSASYEPVMADFTGIDLNLGYIRPQLEAKSDSLYHAEFTLPLCELSQMKWHLKLIVKDNNNFYHKLDYYFTSTH